MATLMFIKILCIRTVYELTPYYRKRGGIMIVIDKPLVRYNLEIPHVLHHSQCWEPTCAALPFLEEAPIKILHVLPRPLSLACNRYDTCNSGREQSTVKVGCPTGRIAMVVLKKLTRSSSWVRALLEWFNRDNDALYPRLDVRDAIRRFECKRRVTPDRECE
jgi:hypothetical protein